jgi:hypothetical protein
MMCVPRQHDTTLQSGLHIISIFLTSELYKNMSQIHLMKKKTTCHMYL